MDEQQTEWECPTCPTHSFLVYKAEYNDGFGKAALLEWLVCPTCNQSWPKDDIVDMYDYYEEQNREDE